MPSRKLERDLSKRCVTYARERGWIVGEFKTRDWPDRVFIGPNQRVVWVEFKRPGGKPRPAQSHLHREFEAYDHPVSVVDDFDQFRSLLRPD